MGGIVETASGLVAVDAEVGSRSWASGSLVGSGSWIYWGPIKLDQRARELADADIRLHAGGGYPRAYVNMINEREAGWIQNRFAEKGWDSWIDETRGITGMIVVGTVDVIGPEERLDCALYLMRRGRLVTPERVTTDDFVRMLTSHCGLVRSLYPRLRTNGA